MLQVNLKKLEDIKNRIIYILGKEFICEMDSFKTIGLKQSEVERAYSRVHPFAIWWDSFKKDIQNSKATGKMMLSENSLRVITLLSALEDIENVPNFIRILNSIRGKGTFYSAFFEANIASIYFNRGNEIKIQEEGIIKNKRVSDFILNAISGDVFLECKSLENFNLKESPLWNQLIQRIHGILKKYKKSWEVNIFAGKQINGKDMEQLCLKIGIDIKNNNIGEKVIDKYFKVNYKKLYEWDQKIYGAIQIHRAEIGSFETEMLVNESYIQISQNCTLVQVMPYIELDVSERLIREFKKAVGQIPKSGPGIIHIEIPYSKGEQLLKVIDIAYPQIYKKLNLESRRVNAVVISGAVIEYGTETPLVYNHYVVPNNNPRTKLPGDYYIIGTYDTGLPLADLEGTIEFDFKLKDEINPGIPSIIFNHCDRTGEHQMRVWSSWNKKLRMDIVNPILGRVFIEAEYDGFVLNSQYRFAGRWSKEELGMFVNGKKKAVKKNE